MIKKIDSLQISRESDEESNEIPNTKILEERKSVCCEDNISKLVGDQMVISYFVKFNAARVNKKLVLVSQPE